MNNASPLARLLRTPLPHLAAAAMLSTIGQAAGPVSELFLTPGFDHLAAIQGTAVLFNVGQSPFLQSPLAVNSTIRTLGVFATRPGTEYTLAGVPTGTSYPFPTSGVAGNANFQDGTTDGSFNYASDVNNGTVYRFSLTWTNPQLLFSIAGGPQPGITYDPSNNSLWVMELNVGKYLISDYSLGGTLLSSFDQADPFYEGLALDPADGTLWTTSNANNPLLTLKQYARSAPGSFNLLELPMDTETYSGVNSTAYGAEFQYTGTVAPEPASAALLGLGTLLLAARRRRRV